MKKIFSIECSDDSMELNSQLIELSLRCSYLPTVFYTVKELPPQEEKKYCDCKEPNHHGITRSYPDWCFNCQLPFRNNPPIAKPAGENPELPEELKPVDFRTHGSFENSVVDNKCAINQLIRYLRSKE